MAIWIRGAWLWPGANKSAIRLRSNDGMVSTVDAFEALEKVKGARVQIERP
jgi:hypothetical protein